jgi:hypothetical protein
MKHTTFKKNLLTVLIAVVLVLLGCWLVGISRADIINGMTLVAATMVMTLMLEDFWRKFITAKNLITLQYVLGMFVVSASVLAWLWAAESVTDKEMGIRLGATFFLAVLGGWWFNVPYSRSVSEPGELDGRAELKAQEKLAKKWAKWRGKIKKASPDDALLHMAAHLVFRPIGDTIDGDLDFSRPVGLIDGNPVTFDELKGSGLADPGTLQVTSDYLARLARTI